jgi:proline iminopeptidase
VEEVEEVRKKLAKDKVILLGHSWGGLLALAYAVKYQNNLKALIVSSGLSSVPLTVKEMRRLIEKLPEQTKNTIYECEKNNDFSSDRCTKAVNEFYLMHLFMFHRFPDFVQKTFNFIANRKIYKIMNGPTEFEITGTIKDIDITNNIKKINIPTLILVGEHDEVTPRVAQVIHDNIKNSLFYVIPNS